MTSILSQVEADSARILKLMVAVPGSVQQDELDRALFLAVRLGHRECVSVLLDAGADANTEVTPGNNALSEAIDKRKIDIVEDLLKAGADVNCQLEGKGNALHIATKKGDTNIVGVLLKAGVNVDTKDRSGHTALLLAAKRGGACLPVIRCLAAAKCDLNQGDKAGRTALHFCAQKGTLTEVLLEAGANPDLQDEDGNTPMHLAATEGFDKVIHCLLKYKANPDLINSFGKTALHYLAMKNHHEAIEDIARCHGLLDVVDAEGRTPLWYAVDHNRPQAVKSLLRCNCPADPPYLMDESDGSAATRDPDRFPLQIALQRGHYGFAKLLVLAGADRTPLYMWMERTLQEQADLDTEREESERLLFPAQRQQDHESEEEDESDVKLEKKDAIVWFSDWLHTPHSLQQSCRIRIRHVIKRSFFFDKNCLNIPPAIVNYITLKEVEDHHITGFQGFMR